jgi:HlyD family secretion protein
MTTISGAIIATGQIEVERNRQVIQHPDGGVVTAIDVQEGEFVESGQKLIELDDTQMRSQLAIIEGQLFELMARRGRFAAERDDLDRVVFDAELLAAAAARPEVANLVEGQRQLFEARRESMAKAVEALSKRKSQIGNQIDGVSAQQTALVTQLGLIEQELSAQQSLLEKGLAQASRVLALQREEARLLGLVGELTASTAEMEGRITEIEIEILKLGTARREEALSSMRDLEYREAELSEQRRSLLERLDRLVIRAPVSGIVYGLKVFALRSVVRPAEPLLFLVPQDRPLVIASQIETIHIDQVYVGQEVHLRFSAFDQRTTPEILGRVEKVSADAFYDEQTRRSFYRAEIVPIAGELDKLAGFEILPGMPVEAYFRTHDRTPLSYLVKPMTDYFNKAFREG